MTKDPHKFAEEFTIVIQTYQPHFTDYYQLNYILVGKSWAQHWTNTLNWDNTGRTLELQMRQDPSPCNMIKLMQMLNDLTGQFLGHSQNLSIVTNSG